MTKAIIYLRSATGNRKQTRQQEADCREYLRERDLTDACTITDTGHPQDGLAHLIDAATKTGATEVVVADLSRLGRKPPTSMQNFDALDDAGLTIHVASGALTGPVADECTRDMVYLFAAEDAQRLHGRREPGA
jgi:DNA invertase Pin-like site-specific DNA recombinase